MGDSGRAVDWQKVEEVTLALMHLTSFKEQGVARSWKGHDWDVLNRLHARGWISNPISKAKSVTLSEDGERLSGELFEKYFGQPDNNEMQLTRSAPSRDRGPRS